MTTIKLKNGSGAPATSDLVQGEPALDLTNKRLYTENASGAIIEVGTNPTSLTTGTFTSTGIDDNATSTAITIDASENVGIGTASPNAYTKYATLTLNGATSSALDFEGGGTLMGEVLATANDLILQTTQSDGQLIFKSAAGAEAMRIDSFGNVGIGSASNHAGARVVINDTPPTAFGSPMFQVGQETFTGSGMYSIGFGYTAGSYTEPPVEIAALTTSDSGGTKADIIFGTRNVTTNTAVTERMRINSSGNVGIGATTVNRKLELAGNNNAGAKANYLRITDTDTTATAANQQGGIEFYASDATGGAGVTASMEVVYAGSGGGGEITFNTAANSGAGVAEAMRIDESGNLLVGTTASVGGGSEGIELRGDAGYYKTARYTAGSAGHWLIYNSNGEVGTVTTSGSATQYNTSSDQRLKDNIVDAPAGNIDAIRVRSFDWKADGSHQTYGMVAQELVDVAPEAVSQGENEDDMWGVDYSKLVPMMIKEIQDLKAEVAALKGE